MGLNQQQPLSDAEIREKQERERLQLANRMHFIHHKILILSGKGGVGKSTVSANFAIALAQSGNKVGLLDIDIHGPSIPKMLNIEKGRIVGAENDLLPIELDGNLKVMSIGFLLKSRDDAVIVRGPMKYHTIRQFLANVAWGKLDYLIIDSPPGTGDEPLTIAQSIENLDGAIIITTPQLVAINDVRKSITFCRKLKLPVVGVLENMSGFMCPHCGQTIDIFSAGGGRRMAEDMSVPFLGRIPLDPAVVVSGDSGTPIIRASPDSPAARAFREAVGSIMNRFGDAA